MLRGREHLGRVAPEDLGDLRLSLEVITPETLLPGEEPLAPDQRRVTVHSRPIWHVGEDGELHPIVTDVSESTELGGRIWRSETNTLKFKVNEEGRCTYKVGQHILRAKPLKLNVEATDGTTSGDVDQVVPSDTLADKDRVVQRGSFSGVRFEHIVEQGMVKEIAWLDSMPSGLTGARWYALSYRWDSDTLTPTIKSGDVVWKTAKGKVVLTWPAPIVEDANGRELRANYRIRAAQPNVVTVLVNAADLRGAAYPVALDPSSTTASGAAKASGSRCSNTIVSTLREYADTFMLITLPDMTGNTVTAARLEVWVIDWDSGTLNASIYACKNATTWDNSSNITTMNSVRTNMGTVVLTNQNSWTVSAWRNLDVFGDSSKGVSKIYTDNINPGDCTFSIRWPSSARTITTKLGTAKVGDFDAGPYLQVAQYNDATHYPRVTITYSTATNFTGNVATTPPEALTVSAAGSFYLPFTGAVAATPAEALTVAGAGSFYLPFTGAVAATPAETLSVVGAGSFYLPFAGAVAATPPEALTVVGAGSFFIGFSGAVAASPAEALVVAGEGGFFFVSELLYPTSVTQLTENGNNWTGLSVGNVNSDNGVYARSDVELFETSCTLRALFSPTIPAGAIILGIEAFYEAKAQSPAQYTGYLTQLVKAGLLIGEDKHDVGIVPTVDTLYTKGSPSDMWTTSLVWSDFSPDNVGFDLRFYNTGVDYGFIYIDFCAMRITWTMPGESGTLRKFLPFYH